MAKDQKIGVLWKLLFGIVACLSFALPVLSDSSKSTKTSCELSLQSTLPTSDKCKMVRLSDGTMLQTVPKLFSPPAVFAGKIPGEQIICRIPDCGKNLCKNGCCEETMEDYNCHCSSGFQGRHCDEQSVTTEAKTYSATERSDGTTSQETTTSKSTELSTTDATSKPTTIPTTTMSDTTTSQETTTSTPPSYEGKQYGFSNAFTMQTFEDARQDCTAFVPDSASDSGLIELTDAEEKAFITGYVSTTSIPNGSSLWIGCPKYLSGDPKHGFYCYHSDYRYSRKNNLNHGYWDWDTSEPQLNDRRCMVLNLATHKYRAEYCDSTAAIALCEWSP